MASKNNKYKGYGISTQAIHTGTDYDEETGEVRRPLHMANNSGRHCKVRAGE